MLVLTFGDVYPGFFNGLDGFDMLVYDLWRRQPQPLRRLHQRVRRSRPGAGALLFVFLWCVTKLLEVLPELIVYA